MALVILVNAIPAGISKHWSSQYCVSASKYLAQRHKVFVL